MFRNYIFEEIKDPVKYLLSNNVDAQFNNYFDNASHAITKVQSGKINTVKNIIGVLTPSNIICFNNFSLHETNWKNPTKYDIPENLIVLGNLSLEQIRINYIPKNLRCKNLSVFIKASVRGLEFSENIFVEEKLTLWNFAGVWWRPNEPRNRGERDIYDQEFVDNILKKIPATVKYKSIEFKSLPLGG